MTFDGSSGGRVYTLDDVEHGLLRGNRPHPYRLFPQFARRDDPRAADGVPAAEVDCRVHFALNCGAKSCPPVDVYTERGLDAELEAARARTTSRPPRWTFTAEWRGYRRCIDGTDAISARTTSRWRRK